LDLAANGNNGKEIMQAEFDRETLLRALQVVEAVVPAKPTREILGRVLLQFGSGGSSLSATDTELEIRHGLQNPPVFTLVHQAKHVDQQTLFSESDQL